jgi:DNA polymerase-3 subunit beta
VKAVIEREELVRGIQAVLEIVPSKSALPVLSNILIDATPDGIELSATDLDISIICGVKGEVEEPGETTVPARKFSEIIRELPDESIRVKAGEGRVSIERQSGLHGTYALMSVPAEDFPDLPGEIDGPEMNFGNRDGEDVESLDGDLISHMVAKTVFAVSRDETRPVLNGVLWQVREGRTTMVATDGHRLVKFSKSLPGPEGKQVVTEAIVPPRPLSHLVKLLGSGSVLDQVRFGQNHLMFSLSDAADFDGEDAQPIRLYTRLIEGPYVDYEQVIPTGNAKKLHVSNSVLAPAVRRVSILASSQTQQVKMEVGENRVLLSANSQEIGGEAEEAVEAAYSDEQMAVGYNSTYLGDVLRRIDSDEVVFELDSPVTAGIIRPVDQVEGEDYLCLLMPLRLND